MKIQKVKTGYGYFIRILTNPTPLDVNRAYVNCECLVLDFKSTDYGDIFQSKLNTSYIIESLKYRGLQDISNEQYKYILSETIK